MSFSSLPDEITENILARISRWNYPSLSLVSKRFHSIISSMELYKTRSQMGTSETCLYVYLHSTSAKDPCPSWFSLCLKPNQTLTKPSRKLISLTIPSSSSHSPPRPSSFTVAVGSEIYVIGGPYSEPSSSVRIFNFRSHTWRDAPSMTVARDDVSAVYLDEKIYVLGGHMIDKSASNYVEEFDIKTQSWRVLRLPDDVLVNDLSGYRISTAVVEGKLYIVANEKDYTYEPKEGTWKVARKKSSWIYVEFLCVVENVMCSFSYDGECMWYDSKVRKWKEVKGMEEFWEHPGSCGGVIQIVNYGGKLLVMWSSYTTYGEWKEKIWYAQIALETRCNGREVWGKVEWIDIMHKDRRSAHVSFHCLTF